VNIPGNKCLPIEQQLAGERAAALSRAMGTLEKALAELASVDGKRFPKVREELLAEARERLWFVIVQREAIGLAHHEVVFETLGISNEVRHAMGPRRC